MARAARRLPLTLQLPWLSPAAGTQPSGCTFLPSSQWVGDEHASGLSPSGPWGSCKAGVSWVWWFLRKLPGLTKRVCSLWSTLLASSVVHTQAESIGHGSRGWEQGLGPSRPTQWSGVEGTFFTSWWWFLAARTVTLYHKVCGFLFSIKSNKLHYLYHLKTAVLPL